MDELTWPDLLRTFALGQASFVLILTILVVIRYSARLAKAPAGDRALPAHITLIGLSYLGMTVHILWDLHEHVGMPITWRTPSSLVWFTFGDAALIFMLVHLSIRRHLVTAVLTRAEQATAIELDARLRKLEERSQDIKETVHAISDVITNNDKPK